jgi:4-amino-4-deoxy-L-arabinose transferase-like glycosyltransferase
MSLAVLALAWGVVLFITGGFDVQWFGVTITSNEPRRPLVLAAVAFAVLVAMDGPAVWYATLGRVSRAVPPPRLAVLLAAVCATAALVHSSGAASGADSYGYVSQADLWLRGRLTIDQPWVADVPWPHAAETFSPLGYRPQTDAERDTTLVPTYSPGLPLLMAAAKAVAGQRAVFIVVPLSAGLLVLATFGLGRRVHSDGAGLIAGWLVAVSPTSLYMSAWPMSDVPAAAAATLMFYAAASRGLAAASGAGFSAAALILIRPNLVLLLAPVSIAFVWRAWSAPREQRPALLSNGAVFACLAGVGIVAVAGINRRLYGGPLTSGYGGLSGMFEAGHVLPNLSRFVSWTARSQGILTFLGLAALIWPCARCWPTAGGRRFRWTALAAIGLAIAMYSAYLVFDAWWFLRFLLPVVPLVLVAAGAAIVMLGEVAPAWRPALAGFVIVSGLLQLNFAANEGSFLLAPGELRYVGAARLVRASTGEASVVLAQQHSGSLRYYGGRMTLRYAWLDPAWLDRAIDWFQERGIRTYLLLQDYELPEFRERFSGQAAVERLGASEVLRYGGPSTILLYDLTSPRPPGTPLRVAPESYDGLWAAPPVPMVSFPLPPGGNGS